MSDIGLSSGYDRSPHTGEKSTSQEVEPVQVDPRQNPEFQTSCKKIIRDQYEYFKHHGKGQFKLLGDFPHSIKMLPDGKKIYIPDIEDYQFHEQAEKKSDQGKILEQDIQKSQEILTVINRQITPFSKTFPQDQLSALTHLQNLLPNTQDHYTLTEPQEVNLYIKQIDDLSQFIEHSKTLQKFFDRIDTSQKKNVREGARAAFATNPQITPKEIDKIITSRSPNFNRHARYETVLQDIDRITEQLQDAIANLRAVRDCIDIQNPGFLDAEVKSPVLLSHWLHEASQSLGGLDYAKINAYVDMLAKDLKHQQESFALMEKDIFNNINETIQEKQQETTPEKQKPDQDWSINDYIWIPKEKYSEMMSRFSQSPEESLKKFYKDDQIGLARALDRLKQQQQHVEKTGQQKQERQRQVQPAMKLLENRPPVSSFQEFDHERFENQTKGAIETIDPALAHGSLFATFAVDLGKNGYHPLPSDYKNLPTPFFSSEQTIDAKTSIVHFPCAQGMRVGLPVPRNYELVSAGFSVEKSDYDNIKNVTVAENENDQTYAFTNLHGEGYIHYVIRQKDQPDIWSHDEQQKNKNTFESPYDRPEIKQVIQKAHALKTIEEKTNFIKQELSKMDFIYTKGSHLLDTLYHEIGKDRFYALVENIGIGHCQIFSQMVGHIFRQVGIPSRVIGGEISTHYAFSAVGHAKVAYCDEQGVVHEFEATNIAYDKSHRLKPGAQIDQKTFAEIAQKTAQTQNPEEFRTYCADIKTMMIEETPSFERRIAELNEYVNRFNQQIAKGIQTEDDIYQLQKLGLDYNRFILWYTQIEKTDSRYDLYKQYLKIQPLDQCEKYIFQSLTSKLLQNTLTENDLIKITEKLMMNDYNQRRGTGEIQPDFHQEHLAVQAWRILKETSKDTAALAQSEFVLKKIADFGTTITETNWLGDDLEQLLPLLQAVQPEKVDSAKKSATLEIVLNFVTAVLPDREKILLTESDLKARKKVKDFFNTNPWIKSFITDPASFPAKPLEHHDFQHLVLGDTQILDQKEKETLAYNLIKKYFPTSWRINTMNDLCNSIHEIGLGNTLTNAPTSQERQVVVKMIQELIERDIKTRLTSSSPALYPFIQSDQEFESFTEKQAELYLKAEFKNDELNYTDREWTLQNSNVYFLGVKYYFPELSVSQELINQWNGKYEKDRLTQKLPELEYEAEGFNIRIRPKFNDNLSVSLDIFEPSLWLDESKRTLFGEKIARKLIIIQQLCNPPRKYYFQSLLQKIAIQNTEVKSLVKQFFEKQQESILDTVLLDNFWSHTKQKFRYDFLLLHDAIAENKPVPENIPQEIKDFYKLIPTDTISLWLNSKNKTFNSTQTLLIGKTQSETEQNLQLAEKMASARAAKETKTFFHTVAEQSPVFTGKNKYSTEHPFSNFKDMAPTLFTVLTDTAHDGPEFRRKLTVFEKTFRNHLNREGEFVNLNQAFVKKGIEFSDFKKYEGEDISTIDWKASARRDKLIVKKTHHEEEPKHNLCLVNLDNLVMRNQKEFEPHASWEKIFTGTYDKLFSLMIDSSYKNKPLETRLYFHGQEIFKTGLPRFTPLPQQQGVNRISVIRDAVVEIFAEMNKFIPLLQEEYVINAKEKTLMPFLKPEFLPNLRLTASTNLIVTSNKHKVGYLAKLNQATASRVV